jgi:hypothetical protein
MFMFIATDCLSAAQFGKFRKKGAMFGSGSNCWLLLVCYVSTDSLQFVSYAPGRSN